MRFDNCGDNVDLWYDNGNCGCGSSTHDLCKNCGDELDSDPLAFQHILKPFNPGEPLGDKGWFNTGYCPSYDEGWMEYRCEVCKKLLTEEDE